MTTHAPKLPMRRKPRQMKTAVTQNCGASELKENSEFIELMISKKVEHAERNLTSYFEEQSTCGNKRKAFPD